MRYFENLPVYNVYREKTGTRNFGTDNSGHGLWIYYESYRVRRQLYGTSQFSVSGTDKQQRRKVLRETRLERGLLYNGTT